jgi:hypothetical protein
MPDYAYRLVNVFAESTLAGNPLCVFEDGRGLDDAELQAIALQFNLSETTFVLPSASATARVRIFTPTFEMAFAGHPTLGTAHVVRALTGTGDAVTLEMRAGTIPVSASGDVWTLDANAPQASRGHGHPRADRGDARPRRIRPRRCATRAAAVGGYRKRAARDPDRHGRCGAPGAAAIGPARGARQQRHAFDGVPVGAGSGAWPHGRHSGADPRALLLSETRLGDRRSGTGSACANLGGWLLATGAALPSRKTIHQGEAVGRPCRLDLEVTAERRIRVSGRVIELGRGTIRL